ncbi:MAG: transporter substrate-binding domain-containing protein [Magnetospirillum sp.]|nr:transporter substrate-binding domain-containing protein [Magnetospirillum sp.]
MRPLLALMLMLILGIPARVLAAEPIVFYGDRDLSPYSFMDQGRPAGASVDLARAVGRALGRDVEIRLTDLLTAQAKVLAGEGDVILNQAPNRERHSKFDFSDPTLPSPFALYSKRSERERLAMQDMAELTIGVNDGGFPQSFLHNDHPDLKMVVVLNTKDGLQRLIKGEIDAFGGSSWVVRQYLDSQGLSGVERLWTFSDRFTNFAVREGDASLQADLNRGLAVVRASGELQRIINRWEPPRTTQLSLGELHAIAVAALAAVILPVILILLLRSARRQKAMLATEIGYRRQVEEELMAASIAAFKSADLLGFVLGGASAAVFEFDLRSRKAYWSPETFTLLGLPPDTPTIPENWEACLHPEDRRLWWDALERALADGQSEFRQEYRIIHADKGVRWLDSRSRIWFSAEGDAERVGGINIDITEMVMASQHLEAAARESAELRADLQVVMDTVPAAIWIARDPEARLIEGNRASYQLLRMQPGCNMSKTGEEAGHLQFKILNMAGEEIPASQLPVQRAARGEAVIASELAVVFEDSVVRYEYGNAVPLRAEDGTVKGAVAAFIDISPLREAEAQLKAAKAEAERANEAKSRFLAATGHDLRQPLQALGLYLGRLEECLAESDRTVMIPIRTCLASLGALLDDLLDLGRLEAGIIAPKPVGFPLAQLLDRIIATHKPAALAKGLKFKVAACPRQVFTDPVLLERVVGNLVANAIRYTDRGGVVVGCRRRQGRLWLDIRDSGIGIPPDMTNEIFEEFVQLGNPERSRDKGIGLGLAFVRRTAQLLGLEVRVRSALGQGAVFSLALPVDLPADRAPTDIRAAAAAVPGRPLLIALIEDDAVVRDALGCALGGLGHQVAAGASSMDTLAGLNGARPDLVISDYRLAGGETGTEAVAALRGALGEDMAAIILTGEINPAVLRAIAEQGIEVQHKPLEFDALRLCVDRHARGIRSERAETALGQG